MKKRNFIAALLVLLLIDVGWTAKTRSGNAALDMVADSASATTTGADTFMLWKAGQERYTPKSLWGFIRLGPPNWDTLNIGGVDTLVLLLKARIDSIYVTLDSQRAAIGALGKYLPLAYTVPSDTVLGSQLLLIVQCLDSVNQGELTWAYQCLWQMYISTSPDE